MPAGTNDGEDVPATPARPISRKDEDDDDDDEDDCWIPTPDASRAAANAAAEEVRPTPARTSPSVGPHADVPDNDDAAEAAEDVLSEAGGSLRRRLSDRNVAARTDTGARNGYHHPADKTSEDNDNNNAAMTNPDMSLLDSLNATVTPPLLSALLFLTRTSLSTTGRVLAPPLHLTRTVLLPALYCSLADLWEATAPTRIKDWGAILTKSARHMWEVLISSPKGRQFRGRAGRVGGDLVDAAATPASRRAIVEGTAALIKAGEALRTPEVRSLLDQCAVLGCRLLDAASTGAMKELVGDLAELMWDGVELLVQRDTVVGLAECCAYLCHALEMEHGVWRERGVEGRRRGHGHARQRRGGDDGEGETRQSERTHHDAAAGRAEAARRRRERGRRNARLYGSEGDADGTDADGALQGIEEAILGSLGDAYRIYGQNNDDGDGSRHHVDVDVDVDVDADGTMSLPSRVFVESPTAGVGGGGGAELGDGLEPPSTGIRDDCSSIGDGQDDCDATPSHKDSSFANEACDVEFLRRRISQRARTMEAEQRRNRARRQEGSVGDVVDIEEASNVSEFYKLVDQISSERQAETVSNILREEGEAETSSKRKFYARAAAAAGAGNERGQDTLKDRLEAYVSRKSRERANIGVGSEARRTQRNTRSTGFFGSRLVVWFLVLWFLLGCAIIGGFSCYGIYVFVFAPATPPTMASIPSLKGLSRSRAGRKKTVPPPAPTIPQQSSPPVPTEIVVRIVREVVHVTPDGNAYTGSGAELQGPISDDVDTAALEEKIADAAVGAIQKNAAKNGLGEENSSAEL